MSMVNRRVHNGESPRRDAGKVKHFNSTTSSFLHDGVATEVVPGEAFYRSQQRKQQPPPQQQTLT